MCCTSEAAMEGVIVVKLEDVVSNGDLFVTTTDNRDIIQLDHIKQMKHNAITCNMSTSDKEIDVLGLQVYPRIWRVKLKPLLDRYVFPATNVVLLAHGHASSVASSKGHPSVIMSYTFSNYVVALLDFRKEKNANKYEWTVYKLTKDQDEKIARLHLDIFVIRQAQTEPLCRSSVGMQWSVAIPSLKLFLSLHTLCIHGSFNLTVGEPFSKTAPASVPIVSILQLAAMEGILVVKLEDVVCNGDLFVTANYSN
ncbi:hypothetical protein Acr_06g0001290 [Actinidia rufa]|uniref:Adenosylhomocysteinase n=1 Tax=Actinidia rufa TaxID=165716 RepID=A0A7J0EQ98_9ERIC|nr:hypothetical protein Acr_06g0001290 [Actinidia rufa]